MFIFNISNTSTFVLCSIAMLLLIILGKELKKPLIPAISLFAFLLLAVTHTIQIGILSDSVIETYKSILLNCVAIDGIMILISFMGFLWVDEIASKFYKKKSIDNSLDWFWNKL